MSRRAIPAVLRGRTVRSSMENRLRKEAGEKESG